MKTRSEVIKSRQNPAIQRLAALDEKKYRDADRIFSIDGYKLLLEAVQAQAQIVAVYLSSEKTGQYLQSIENLLSDETYRDTEVIIVEEELFHRISREKSPQGVVTLVKYLDKIQNLIKIYKVTAFSEMRSGALLLDGVRDPGNLGAIVRSAVAFGIRDVLLSRDCVDLYNPKVIRSAMGGIFRLRASYVEDLPGSIREIRRAGHRVYAAELRPGARSIQEVGIRHGDTIVIGNEGHGISVEVSRACDGSVYLPISPEAESLNAAVAASIFLWEMKEV